MAETEFQDMTQADAEEWTDRFISKLKLDMSRRDPAASNPRTESALKKAEVPGLPEPAQKKAEVPGLPESASKSGKTVSVLMLGPGVDSLFQHSAYTEPHSIQLDTGCDELIIFDDRDSSLQGRSVANAVITGVSRSPEGSFRATSRGVVDWLFINKMGAKDVHNYLRLQLPVITAPSKSLARELLG